MEESSKLICVIEDNMPIRKLFCTLLRKSGYSAVDFGDGQSAIEWIRQNNASLVIMDILLPDLNGTDLIKMVRALDHYSNTPVIAVTGFAGALDRDKFIELGFDSYLSKPINTTTFVAEIEKLIK